MVSRRGVALVWFAVLCLLWVPGHVMAAERVVEKSVVVEATLDQVWDSFLHAPDSLPLTLAQAEELDRRQVDYDMGHMSTTPWPDLREDIRRRLRQDE